MLMRVRLAFFYLVSVSLGPSTMVGAGCTRQKEAADAGATRASVERATGRTRELSKSFRGQEVWFVGGFMSQLYDALSEHLEDEVNEALKRAARSLNVHLDLPGDRSVDIEIGDAIADTLPRIDLHIEKGRFVSFYTQMQDFNAKGIPYRNISLMSAAFNTSQSVEHNAAAILALLRHTNKKVILVTHSKGGLDTLDALLQAPQLWGKTVIGWVALQAPFGGSPLADPTPAQIDELLLEALGGNSQAVEDLKTSTRTLYMKGHAPQIQKLTSSIPVVSAYTTFESSDTVSTFAGTLATGVFSADLVSEITTIVSAEFAETPKDLPRVIGVAAAESTELISRRVADAWSDAVGTVSILTLPNVYLRDISKVPNDGLVPKDSTMLPGSRHRQLPTGDHASPVMDVEPFKSFWTVKQRNEITLGLIDEVRGGH
jgi:pimeloyl-ACP methyl ester carboxylesterase